MYDNIKFSLPLLRNKQYCKNVYYIISKTSEYIVSRSLVIWKPCGGGRERWPAKYGLDGM